MRLSPLSKKNDYELWTIKQQQVVMFLWGLCQFALGFSYSVKAATVSFKFTFSKNAFP